MAHGKGGVLPFLRNNVQLSDDLGSISDISTDFPYGLGQVTCFFSVISDKPFKVFGVFFSHTYFNSTYMHAMRILSFLWVPTSLILIHCLRNVQFLHSVKHFQLLLTPAQHFQNRPYTQLKNSDITLEVQKQCERLISTLEVTSKLVCHRKPGQQSVGFHQIMLKIKSKIESV